MKIPLTMREQYQGQLSASMLYILFCAELVLVTGSFFLEKIILIRKTKNTAISCGVDFKMVTSAGLEPATF